ncbi:hypothetical protein Dimus_026051 [Dionaea muscipula]
MSIQNLFLAGSLMEAEIYPNFTFSTQCLLLIFFLLYYAPCHYSFARLLCSFHLFHQIHHLHERDVVYLLSRSCRTSSCGKVPMAGRPWGSLAHEDSLNSARINLSAGSQLAGNSWYFSIKDIINHSPSRKDDIDYAMETQLQLDYCKFLKKLGMRLKVAQKTIATAMVFCHRFYTRQSHAKNDWKIIAAASIFLAGKVEYQFRLLSDVVIVASDVLFKKELRNSRRIYNEDVYDELMKLLPIAEYHLLATISFDINIELPYGPLVAALKKLNIAHGDVLQVAWNFVNDWCCTPLFLIYQPHYVAAASLFFVAQWLNLSLPSSREKPWWLEFEVSPKRLQGIIKLLGGCFEYEKVDIPLTTPSATEFKREMRSSSKSCISTSDHMDRVDVTGERWHDPLLIKSSQNPAANVPYLDQHGSKFQSSNRRSSKDIMDHSVVENASQTKKGCYCDPPDHSIYDDALANIDVERIRETLKRRRCEKASNKDVENEALGEDWIERELERGVEQEYGAKRRNSK